MESDSTKAFVESKVKRQGGTRKPEIMRKIIEKLTERNQVSFSMTKYRLIELGFHASGRYKSTTYRNGQAFRNQVDPVTDRYRPRSKRVCSVDNMCDTTYNFEKQG